MPRFRFYHRVRQVSQSMRNMFLPMLSNDEVTNLGTSEKKQNLADPIGDQTDPVDTLISENLPGE